MVCLYLVLIRVSGKSSWRSLFPYQEGSFCSKTSWKAQEGGFVQSITSYVSPAVFYTSIPCVIQYYPWIRHTVKLLALWPFTCRSDEWGSRLLMHMANYNFESLYPSYSTCLTLILENILSTFLCWDFFRWDELYWIVLLSRTRIPSSGLSSLRAGFIAWPVTTRPKDFCLQTGNSMSIFLLL